MNNISIGIFFYLLLLFPPIIRFLEGIMISHMLVQLTLLVFSGWLVGDVVRRKLKRKLDIFNEGGVPGILFFLLITMYWMLPRVMDETLTYWYIEMFKFISLPASGILLRDSWRRLGAVGKSFIYLNYISMFGVMAWLYIDAPVRVCNSYLENDQKILGWGFFILTLAMLFYVIQQAFIDHREEA